MQKWWKRDPLLRLRIARLADKYEQWPSYWRSLFATEGFGMFDPIRPRIRENNAICWWYRQNLVVFASQEAVLRYPSLGERITGDDIQWVHISLLRHKRSMRSSLLKAPGAMWAWSRIKPWVRSHVTCPETPTVDNAADDGAS
jgi:hypothetical protein